jgi:hypothetical protein
MAKQAQMVDLIYEYAALPDWETLDPGVVMPLNTPVCIAVKWQNTGSEDLTVRVYLTVTDPYGTETPLSPDLYYATLAPGEDTWIYFDNIMFVGEGAYHVTISLIEQGETLAIDSITIPVSASHAATPPDGNGLPSETLPVIGFAAAIGVVGAVAGMTMKMEKKAIKE